jgi:hypothetical protein
MFKLLEFIDKVIDIEPVLCDKCPQPVLSENLDILQNDFTKGANYGTVRDLKIHANLPITHKIFFKLFHNISILHVNSPPRILPERANLPSQSSLPSFSPLPPVARAKELT